MDNFKTMFQKAQQELRDQQRAAQQASCQAYGIWCLPTAMNDHPLQAKALANLATAMVSDRQALQNLTNMVKELSNQIKAKDQQIEDLINTKTTVSSNRSNHWRKKTAAVTVTPMGAWLAPNKPLKIAANQVLTIPGQQHVKIPWVATWKANPTISKPDKLGQLVIM